jgi:tRNA A-37 threonylcarbamoyl transferase component Bud32
MDGLLKIADGGRYSAEDIREALAACGGDQKRALAILRNEVGANTASPRGLSSAASSVPMHGYMTKKGGMRWQKRWFELHSAVREGQKPLLKYFKERGDAEVRGELELDAHTTVANLASKTGGFQIICTGGRAMKVAADNDDEARRWKAQINQAIREASSIHMVTVGGQVYEIDRRYVPKRRIGSGAYGTVISAVDEQSGSQVAIKKVARAFDDLIDAKRILREVRLMRTFSHPNILGLYDLIRPSSLEHFEDVYIISLKKSSDMQRIIFSDTPLSEDQQQWIMYQCLCGIKYMHSAGVLHRDLKPSNLLVDTETCDVQICDFGLSRCGKRLAAALACSLLACSFTGAHALRSSPRAQGRYRR